MIIFHAQKSSLGSVRRALLGLVLLFTGFTVRAAIPAVEGTMPEDYLPELKEILQTALKQSPQMISREIAIAQADAARYGTDAWHWPELSGYLSYDTNQSSVSSNTSTKSKNSGIFYSINISQSIFQWGALKNQSQISKIGVMVEQKNYDEAFRLLAANLRAQYLALVVKKAALSSIRFRQKISENALAVEEDKFKNGSISAGDMISPRLSVEESKLGVARAEEDLANSKRLFAHLAGYSELSDDKIAPGLPKADFSADKAQALLSYVRADNAESTFQAQIYAMNREQADLNYRIAKVRLLPKIYWGASVGQRNDSSVSGNVVNQASVLSQSAGINAQWKIFDAFATTGAKKSALESRRYFERLRQTQIQTVLDQAQNLERMLLITSKNTDLTETRLQLAEAGMKRVEDEVTRGNLKGSALDAATEVFYASAINAAAARAEYFSRWSDFVSLVGADPILNQIPAHHVR